MTSYETFGRTRQKHRTRAALKTAAIALIEQGATPTIAEVADAALVSRSTAYRYFPSAESLQAEVLLDTAIREDLEQVYAVAQGAAEPAERLDDVVRRDDLLVAKHETAFRTALRALIKDDTADQPSGPRRPGNRLRYLAAALTPISDDLAPGQRRRLIAALSLCVGVESFIVTRDVCGLTDAEAAEVKRWAASALLHQAVREASQD